MELPTLSFLPSSFGDHHFCPNFMELLPELLGLKCHFRIILNVVVLWRRRSGRKSSKRKSWKESWVAVGWVKTVGRSQTWKLIPLDEAEGEVEAAGQEDPHDDVIPGKGRLHGGDEGWRRPPRPKSGLGRKGGENAMLRLLLLPEGDITGHSTRHWCDCLTPLHRAD